VPESDTGPWVGPRLILLRHGEIASHHGDIPLTERGHQQARRAGRAIGRTGTTLSAVLTSATVRTRETAADLYLGLRDAAPELTVTEPRLSFALRNPDLYLAGHHVNFVSTATAFCEQAPVLSEAQCLDVPFIAGFLNAPDRIRYWLTHPSPPGDDSRGVATRLATFVASLADVPGRESRTLIGITHSPLLRALALEFLGADPGEPEYLHGYSIHVRHDRGIDVEPFNPYEAAVPRATN